MLLLFSSILLGACVRDIIDDVPVPDEDNEIDKKDVVLVRMGTDDAEVKILLPVCSTTFPLPGK